MFLGCDSSANGLLQLEPNLPVTSDWQTESSLGQTYSGVEVTLLEAHRGGETKYFYYLDGVWHPLSKYDYIKFRNHYQTEPRKEYGS